jgi:hypothetical protein
MSQTGHIYVPTLSGEYLAAGLERQTWGWRPSALDRGGARQAVAQMIPGDYLIFGHRGPNSRVKPGGWATSILHRVIVAKLETPLHIEHSPIWPDDEYPERIGFQTIAELSDLSGSDLGNQAMESLRLSANKQGAPVVTPGIEAIGHLIASLAPTAPTAEPVPDPPVEQEILRSVIVRRSISAVRKAKLGGTETACAFCGRTLPNRLINVVHIVPLYILGPEDADALGNVTVACQLGCAELFHQGFVYVNTEGIITRTPRSRQTPDVHKAVDLLDGRLIANYEANAAHFAAHRERHDF